MNETSQGIEVADTARSGEEARKNRERDSELQISIEFLHVKQNKLWVQTWKRTSGGLVETAEVQARYLLLRSSTGSASRLTVRRREVQE